MLNLALLLGFALIAEPAPDGKPSNIALGRPYVLSPAPNYPLTTDEADAVQLTDGKHAGGGFWTDKAAVGWSNVRPISVTIDLGSLRSVSGVSLSMAAGRAGVQWPGGLYLSCSGDGRAFTYQGDLVALGLGRGVAASVSGFARRRFTTTALAAHCRFVRVMVDVTGPYAFIDEVEVYAGPDQAPRDQQGVLHPDGLELYWKAHAARRLKVVLQEALLAAHAHLDRANLGAEQRAAIVAMLDDVGLQAAGRSLEDWWPASDTYPFDDLHARALAAIGLAEQVAGAPPLRAWASNPWDPLTMTATPAVGGSTAVSIALMNGEVRAGAVNVRNSTGHPQRVSVELNLAGTPRPGWIRASTVEWTGDAEARPVASALRALPADSPESFSLPAGTTRQVWLSFAPTALAPGTYDGAVTLSSDSGASAGVPVKLQVLPGQMPARKRLHVGGWDYLNQPGIIKGSLDYLRQIALTLQEYGVDLPWATASAMPFGRYDEAGKLIEPPSTAVFDAWLALWPDAVRYRVFISARDSLAGHQLGTSGFREAMKAWAQYWAAHLRTKGVAPDRVDLLFVDEPNDKRLAERQEQWARALQASGSGLQVWIDPAYEDVDETPEGLLGTSDTVCLHRVLSERSLVPHRALAKRVLAAGKALELYSTDGPVTALDPYVYYRLQAWRAFDLGATAVSHWSFTDTGKGSSWQEYVAPGKAYAPLFLDGARVAATKHLAAIREGVQDHEYLAMLRDAIATEAATRKPNDPALSRAREVLSSSIRTVLQASRADCYAWVAPVDRSVADTARLQVAEVLRSLQAPPTNSP